MNTFPMGAVPRVLQAQTDLTESILLFAPEWSSMTMG
jgi:hypothetical protein